MSRLAVTMIIAAALSLLSSTADARQKVLHEERSLYQTILVVQEGSRVCLLFSVKREQRNQSCIDVDRPRRMQFSYTQMMMSALLLVEAPRSVLMVGLGGGTLPTALHELYPEVEIDAVEIDPAVVRVARKYFGFQTSERLRVHEIDARVFTKRALRRGKRYDLILLDAYNGDYIPEHLLTREYLQETAALLEPGGVVAANTFAVSDLYDHESATYAAVFGRFYNFKRWNSANRVILARPDGLPEDPRSLQQAADALRQPLSRYGVPIHTYPKDLDGGIDWREDARVLTDQYAPANLLKH